MLRAAVFALAALLVITVIHPFGVADTFAAQPVSNSITLVYDGTITEHTTTARTILDFLQEQGITLYPADQLNHNPRIRVANGFVVELDRAFNVNVSINGEEEERIMPRGTIAEAKNYLEEALGLTLLFDGDLQEDIYEEDYLAFTTWRSRIEADITKVPYETNYIINPYLDRGTEIVLREGELGENRLETEIIYIRELEYSREFAGEFFTEPVTRIVETYPESTFALGALADTSCNTFRYARRIVMEATAYTAGFSCTGKRPGHPAYRITRSGREVEHGIVAVDPAFIPLGTKLYVEGYGFAIAADTGSAIRGYKIDLFMEYIGDALRFGRRNVVVFVLEQ